jgi:Ig domain of plant-specific actin-binding protein
MPTLTPSQTPARRLARLALIGLLVICGCCLISASTASATDFAWSGGGSSDSWSDGANWIGGVAPASSSSLGTLSFPAMPSAVQTTNDLTGLSVNQLQVEDSHGYTISGQGLALGGLSLSAATGGAPSLVIASPISLTNSQTWNLTGSPDASLPNSSQALDLNGGLTGAASDLTINVDRLTGLGFGDVTGGTPLDYEIGNVTINGVDTANGGGGQIFKTLVDLGSSFNDQDGHSLTLHHVELHSSGATGPIVANQSNLYLSGNAIGPLTVVGSQLQPSDSRGIASVGVASLSLDADSSLNLQVGPDNLSAGSSLSATGNVSLGEATLDLLSVTPIGGGNCLPPTVGTVTTLVSTSGSLSGTFGGIADGGSAVAACFGSTDYSYYSYRINYHRSGPAQTVTATALPEVPVSFNPPTISGTATEGQSLSLSTSSDDWGNAVTSYAHEWQRCDSAGNNCQDISGATSSSYSLTGADVGSTIRAQVIASNADGDSQPAVSTPTAVVQATTNGPLPPSQPPPPPVIHQGSDGNPPPIVGPVIDRLPAIGPAQIEALLKQQFAQLTPPSGKSTRIGALLKSGGLTMPFTTKVVGILTVGWYQVASGAKLAKKTKAKAKPVLVASGKLTFKAAGTGRLRIGLTAAGRRLLGRAQRVRLTVRGRFVAGGGVVVSGTTNLVVRH